ncbi:MAG: hypothetical protein PF961_07230 [Planctomycetota bacterium]|nr:hypothetical protein [Planctomycetota bacterium]
MSPPAPRQLEHDDHVAGPRFALCLLAHDVVVPMNIGSLFRVADALGLEAVHCTGSSPVPPNTKINRLARGAERHVPFTQHADPQSCLGGLRAQGYRLVSLELTATSVPLAQLAVQAGDRMCLIVGSEKHGVAPELIAASEACVHIPMHGHNSSMNLATAAAIACYDLTQRLAGSA